MAEGFEYYQLGGLNISPNNKYVAFATDTISRRQYNIQIKDLETGKIFTEVIKNTTGGCVWANDNKSLFYTQKNPETLRSERIFKHILGTDPAEDIEIYFEKDDTFSVFVTKSKSDQYIFIESHSTLATESRYIKANEPDSSFKIFQKRERDLEYSVAHYKDHFYITTNKDKALNYKVMKTPVSATTQENWEDVIPHRADVMLEDISIFKDYLVLEERKKWVK